MKRGALVILVLGFGVASGYGQSQSSPYARQWLVDSPASTKTEFVRTSFRNGPSWGSPNSPCGDCATCGTDRNCMRKLIEFATYRPQYGCNCKKVPTEYTPPLLAWFPGGSQYCSGDCGTNAACRDRKKLIGGNRPCYGPACGTHMTLAERPAMAPARNQWVYRPSPGGKQPSHYGTEEPPARHSHTTVKPAAYLSTPAGYRMQPSYDLLPPRRW
jgi:hypothetical protein